MMMDELHGHHQLQQMEAVVDSKWGLPPPDPGRAAHMEDAHSSCSSSSVHADTVDSDNASSSIDHHQSVMGSCVVSPDDPILKKGNSILDGKYFMIVERNDKRIKVACQSCPNKKTLCARVDALSNLVTHMKKMHPEKLVEMQLYRDSKTKGGRKRSILADLGLHAAALGDIGKLSTSDDKGVALAGATSTTGGGSGTDDDYTGAVSTSTGSSPAARTAAALAAAAHRLEANPFLQAQAKRIMQKEAEAAIASYIVQGFHPLSTVEQPEFRHLVTTLNSDVVVLSRRSVSRQIEGGYNSMVAGISEEVSMLKYICTTADVCSVGQANYICVTVQWIDATSMERRRAIIACRRITQKEQRAAGEVIDEALRCFGARECKITARLTDNVRSCAEAFKEFNITVSTGNRGQFNVADEEEFTCEFDDENDSSASDGLSRSLLVGRPTGGILTGGSPNLLSVVTGGVQVSAPDVHMVLPNHVSCASFLLDQVITIDSRHSLQTKAYAELNNAVFGKCSALWKLAAKPKSSQIIREKLGCLLSTPCTSKWTSVYESVCNILQFKEKVNEIMRDLHLPEFQEMDLEFLSEYADIVKPLAVVVTRLRDEKQWFYGELIPALLVTDNKIDMLGQKMFRYCFPLYHSVNYGFKSRFASYLNLQPDVNDALLATVSHPFFKLRWLQSKPVFNTELMRKHLHNMLLEAIMQGNEHVQHQMQAAGDHSRSDHCISQGNRVAGGGDDDDFYDFEFKNSPLAVSRDLEMQVYSYFQETDTRPTLLHNYPAVRDVFLRHNTTVLSSECVEKLLCSCGLLQSNKRSRISDAIFEKFVLLKGNQHKFE